MSSSFDIVVVGGGIVGMATAMALLPAGRSLAVLEAEGELGAHQTGRNSGVIHSGIYYKPGSLKATLCTRGREAMLRFCKERGVPFELCGKVIVATSESERAALEVLAQRGAANGIEVERFPLERLREREPAVRGVASLHVPGTGIVDYTKVTQAMAAVIEERGGEVKLRCRVLRIDPTADEFRIETSQGLVRARNVVNCAGLHSDEIARMCGVDAGLRIIPFRGEYFDLVESKASLCRHLIYPVPDPRFPFLGVHFTRATSGKVEAGPNAVLALKREGYDKTSFSPADTAEMLTYGGFWKMAATHWRTGVGEMARSLSKARFVRSLQALVPEITEDALVPGRAGVRAQAVDTDGKLADDFRLVDGTGMLHVLNAPSPAATASIAIGEVLAERAQRVFRATR